MVDGMPQGLPAAGDQGLDNTHIWGRTYRGGAMFCLLADIEIRKQTGNAKGLLDALRAINRAATPWRAMSGRCGRPAAATTPARAHQIRPIGSTARLVRIRPAVRLGFVGKLGAGSGEWLGVAGGWRRTEMMVVRRVRRRPSGASRRRQNAR